jgi:hypothetical protein
MASPNRVVRPHATAQIEVITANDVLTVLAINIDLEFGMLLAVLWLTIGALLWIKKYGSTTSGGLNWSGVILPTALG